MEFGLFIILVCVVAYCMVAKRASSSIITAPMVFLAIGILIANSSIMGPENTESMLDLVAEVSLIILLFLDASQSDLAALRRDHVWPQRMLLIGLPLCIAIGVIVAIPLFPDLPLPLLALMAAILAPTDAALGQAVVNNKNVPERERRSLTVESGLNDGMALPIILLFASLVMGLEAGGAEETNWFAFGIMQVVLGPIAGVTLGWLGARLFLYAEAQQLTAPTYEGIAVLALAGSSYLFAQLIGGNGFIASFVAGLIFGHLIKGHCRFIYEFSESEGQMLVWAAFLFIGLGLLPEALSALSWPVVVYILLSFFFVRPLAICLSLLGTDTSNVTRLFFGWFGPRGLATALFALLVAEELNHEYAEAVVVLAVNAVWMSALLHGITASPGADWYARKAAKNIDFESDS